MKRTLLVDTNRAAVPIYRELCHMGHDVWVVGSTPTETLAKLASNYVQLDYSDKDRLASFVKEQRFHYLVPGCTDLSYQVCAEIADGSFPGIDNPASTNAINSKIEFRKTAADLGLPIPRVFSLTEAADAESVIVKPVDSFSGRGMTVLQDPVSSELARASEVACKASKTGEAIIEEFVSGQLFSYSAFVWNGKVVADFVVQEDCTIYPFAVDTSRAVELSPGATLESLRRNICDLASSLRLANGLIHTQFVARGDHYWIIEVTRRCPGDLYSLLIEFSTGYPYAASYVAPFVGEVPKPRVTGGIPERITRHTVTSKNGASLWGYRFNCPVDIRLFVPLATSGDFIDASPYGRAGIFFFSSPSAGDQDDLYGRLLNRELYDFD